MAATTTNGPAAALPVSPDVVEILMEDSRFDLEHDLGTKVRSGRVVFRTQNAGKLEHDLLLIGLPEDLPGTLADQLRSPTRRAGRTIARQDPHRPGASGFFAVDLPPGRYGLLCSIVDTDGQTHALKGMSAEFRVT